MKKNLLYVLAILFFAGMWCSCSKDDGGEDDEKGPLTPPEVTAQNMSLKNAVLPGSKVRLRANIINTTKADLQWLVNGEEVSHDTIYEFSSTREGEYRVKVIASNVLGTASDSLDITVKDGFKISDITNWTGQGDSQSVLAIQWVAANVEDLLNPADEDIFFRAWGYKWNAADNLSGYDMIKAIAANDPRLFVIVAPDGSLGMTIKGFGYDGNGDGKFEIRSKDKESSSGVYTGIHLTEADFTDGIYEQKIGENIDDFELISGADYWIGGWYTAYPSYWLGVGDAVLDTDEYEYSNFYANNRWLEDKSWDAWTFSPINNAERNIAPIPRLLKAAPAKQ